MIQKTLILCIVVLLAAGKSLMAVKLSEKTIRQIEKTAKASFDREELRFELISLDTKSSESLPWQFDKNSLYHVYSDSILLGYLVVDQAMGRYDPFDFLIIYHADLSIIKIEILKYRSAHGGEIASTKWLKKFEGSSRSRQQSFKEIDALSGASYSSNGLKNAVSRIDKSIWLLFGKKEND